jgi:hypothetical protein
MDTWELLEKELNYYGIRLINNKKCQITDDDGKSKTQGVIKTIRILNKYAKDQKAMLLSLWKDVEKILQKSDVNVDIIDDRMITLFIFSLKDFIKYLQCFEDSEKTEYYDIVSKSLSRDIKTFNKTQIYSIPDYKIAIDWISRNISRLLYICNLLSLASMGRSKVSKLKIKTAGGIAGPWSRLDLPMEERMFPFGFGLKEREKGKQTQNRYTKGLMNYNNDGRVGEGHYWRELRNEPFDWFDRESEDPYPSRKMLSGRA